MRKDGEYSTTDKFIRNTAKFNSNNLSCAQHEKITGGGLKMVYTESIRGYPYMRKEQLAKEFQIGTGTVRTRLLEIENEIKTGRYNDYAVIRDGNIILINVLVFIDYLTYRRQLLDSNARKYTPAFHPEKLVQMIGWSNRAVVEEGAGGEA